MAFPLLRRLAVVTALACAGLSAVAGAQTVLRPTPVADTPADKPASKLRSIPYVAITRPDGTERRFETNAIPLLFNRTCFGWRMYLGGPNRTVSLIEVLTTSQPAEQVIAGPETKVSPDKTKATTHMTEIVQDGVLQRAWCIIPGDPPHFLPTITIDGEPRGQFVFCAIEDTRPESQHRSAHDLNCPNKFNAVER